MKRDIVGTPDVKALIIFHIATQVVEMGWRIRLHNRMTKAKLRSALCLVASWTGENAAFSKVVRTCYRIFVSLPLQGSWRTT